MLRKFYLGLGSATLLGYATMTGLGWELTAPARGRIANPQTVRSSPGGFRSHTFWHSGYHGGK